MAVFSKVECQKLRVSHFCNAANSFKGVYSLKYANVPDQVPSPRGRSFR